MNLPRLTGWMLRLALIYFLIGFTMGAVLLAGKAGPILPGMWALLPPHIELLLIGWALQMILAVAYWIFPRYALPPARGNPTPAWIAAGALNAGIVLVVLAPLTPFPAGLMLAGRGIEMLSVSAFGILLVKRLRPYQVD